MKKLLFLFTAPLLISCSSEDDVNENQSFLDKYDEYGFTDGDEYWFFFNDTVFLRYAEPAEFTCFELKKVKIEHL